MTHLWEIDHPYYGADGSGPILLGSLDELIENSRDFSADMNHIYRWDWDRYDPDDFDGEAPEDTLTLYVVMPRKSQLTSWSAPVTEADEPKVREFLTSDRVLGALRTMWEPFLTEPQQD